MSSHPSQPPRAVVDVNAAVDSGGIKRTIDEDDDLTVQPIGAGSEVGRSCVLLTFKGKTIMFDCGIHPAYTGLSALPYFDEIDPASVDLLLISHFHLDHCAALPYFLMKTNFRGRVFMTHPTKAIYRLVLQDYTKIGGPNKDQLYSEKDVIKTMDRIEPVNYHQELVHEGVRFWCHNAGHVLGAAMFEVDIAGVKVLYTGDFSRDKDRHLIGAELPLVRPDVVISESTYGVQIHEPREQREARFTGIIHGIVSKGGRCLVPVFALGRAQELLLILDEFWQAHPELHHVPIYYASSLAKRCMTVYQTYINMMNDNIRTRFAVSNPFVFKHISALKNLDSFEDVGPSVVLASPGMLQSGISRDLFEMWCSDARNGVLVAGYCVDGTLAKVVLSEPREVMLSDGNVVPLKMSVHYVSFSAHSDYAGTSEFLAKLAPSNIVLVHGEATEMSRLKGGLENTVFKDTPTQIHNPKNCEVVTLKYTGNKIAKAMGSIAATQPRPGDRVTGVLVKKDFGYTLLDPNDIAQFTRLQTTQVTQRLVAPAPCAKDMSVVEQSLRKMFANVKIVDENEGDDADAGSLKPDPTPSSAPASHYLVHETVQLKRKDDDPTQLVLEWKGSPYNDMVADVTLAVIMAANLGLDISDPGATHQGTGPDANMPWTDEHVLNSLLDDHRTFLEGHYEDVQLDTNRGLLNFQFNGAPMSVNPHGADLQDPTSSTTVTCGTGDEAELDSEAREQALRDRVRTIARMADATSRPIPIPVDSTHHQGDTGAHPHPHAHGNNRPGVISWIDLLKPPGVHSCC